MDGIWSNYKATDFHDRKNYPQMVVKSKGNPRPFQGNRIGW